MTEVLPLNTVCPNPRWQGLAEADAMTQAFHAPMLLVYFFHAATPIHASEMAGNRFYGLLIFKIFRGENPPGPSSMD